MVLVDANVILEMAEQDGWTHRWAGDCLGPARELREGVKAGSNIATLSKAAALAVAVTISSRAFNQDAAGAKRAANQGPVFITDRGKPAHVLLSIDAYHRLLGSRGSIADLLCLPGVEELELPLIRHPEPARAADLS
jgi:hypothetical protein